MIGDIMVTGIAPLSKETDVDEHVPERHTIIFSYDTDFDPSADDIFDGSFESMEMYHLSSDTDDCIMDPMYHIIHGYGRITIDVRNASPYHAAILSQFAMREGVEMVYHSDDGTDIKIPSTLIPYNDLDDIDRLIVLRIYLGDDDIEGVGGSVGLSYPTASRRIISLKKRGFIESNGEREKHLSMTMEQRHMFEILGR